jgi:hypothetical protein
VGSLEDALTGPSDVGALRLVRRRVEEALVGGLGGEPREGGEGGSARSGRLVKEALESYLDWVVEREKESGGSGSEGSPVLVSYFSFDMVYIFFRFCFNELCIG